MSKQISHLEATQLCDNYDAKYNSNKNLISIEDNRSCLFSIKEIKDYIDYIEKNGTNIDGIRIYIGSYSSSEIKSTNNNLTTVFLAPTSRGVDDKNINALNWGESGNPPKKKYGK